MRSLYVFRNVVSTILSLNILPYAILGVILLNISPAYASILKALELQKLCHNAVSAQLGADSSDKFNPEYAGKCRGYMAGFYDSVFILEHVTNHKTICVPDYISVENNTAILDSWISANPKLAADANAAVALLSAYERAFPCNKDLSKRR